VGNAVVFIVKGVTGLAFYSMIINLYSLVSKTASKGSSKRRFCRTVGAKDALSCAKTALVRLQTGYATISESRLL